MERIDGGNFRVFTDNPSGSRSFDSSQYEFFGQNAIEEVELGGFEDEDIPIFRSADEEYRLFDKEEVSVDCEIVISPRKQSLSYKQCGFEGLSV